MPRTLPSEILRFIASTAVIVLLTAHSPVLAQQKSAQPAPDSQAQLQARVKDLETRLNAAEQKVAGATMEKDYITRIQKQYESYYEKAFNTQVAIVSIIALFITIVFGLAARFGFGIFDRRIEMSLKETSAQLRTEFTQLLEKETQALRQANEAQLKVLEDDFIKRITEQEQNLKTRSEFQFQFAQGMSYIVTGDAWGGAVRHFRNALAIYKNGKPRSIIVKNLGSRTAANIFHAIRNDAKEKFEETAKKELESDLYKDLEDELTFAATEVKELAPLLRKAWEAAV